MKSSLYCKIVRAIFACWEESITHNAEGTSHSIRGWINHIVYLLKENFIGLINVKFHTAILCAQIMFIARNLKGRIGSLFDHCVNAV